MRARTQLTVAATAVVALLVALTGQFLVWRTGLRDTGDVDRALAARAEQIATEAAKTGRLPTDGAYPVRLLSGTQVRAQSGSTVQFSTPVTDGFSTVAAADGHVYRSWAETLKTGVQLQVLTDYSAARGRHHQAVRLVDLSVLGAILLGGLGSWFAAGIVLRPLRRLEEGARELSPDDLGGRLPSVTEPREVAEVAASVNALLDRMQSAAGRGPDGPPRVGPEPTSFTVTPPPAEPDTFPPRPRPPVVPPPAAPETAGPSAAATSAAPSEAAVSDVAVPEVAVPEVAGPEVAGPEVAGPQVVGPQVVGPQVADRGAGDAALRAALEKLGDDLDSLLDNPELSTTQRHLILASIQNEYRRIVLLTQGD